MKSLIKAVAIAAVLAIPAVSFAQSNQPVTRAQVRAELVQLEKAGYRPGAGTEAHYPDEIQAAQARVDAQNGAAGGYGGVANASQSGRPGVSAADWNAMYNRP
jgi:Tfp pilus assembly protein PilE